MRIQCKCGGFQAELADFPRRTPGRLMCYCDDCQKFLLHIGRADLLDAAGGTEIVPVYPADATIVSGAQHLACTRLSAKGMHRFSTTCCGSPVGNTRPGTAWLGVQSSMFLAKDPQLLDRVLGGVKARIMGKFAKGPVPPGTPDTMNLKAALPVVPFMLKGALGRKGKPSPFLQADGRTPIVAPKVLSEAAQAALHEAWRAAGGHRKGT
jgi:hypothetical protein